jgi:arylsulfatase A-like enzyme
MAEELDFSDLTCYGAEMHTPDLDKLEEEGLYFYSTLY